MPKKGHSDEEIISALKQHESGATIDEICRKFGIHQSTFYLWNKHYAGLGVQEVRDLQQMREEKGGLNRIVADLTLDRQILQEIIAKKL
jgi:putative transposase